jgi:hypothetical protein
MNQDLQKEFSELGKPQAAVEAKEGITAGQALVEGVKEGVGAFIDGIGKAFDLAQASPTLNDMANHGRNEIAAALFNGQANAYVMYQRGSHDQPANENHIDTPGAEVEPQKPAVEAEPAKPSVEVQNPEIHQSRGLHL